MRAFIVLCLVAVACADKLGYNYKPVGHSDFGLSFAPGSSSGHVSGIGGSHGIGGSASIGSGSSFGGSIGGFGVGGSSGGFGIGGSNGGFHNGGGSGVGGFGIGSSNGGFHNGGGSGVGSFGIGSSNGGFHNGGGSAVGGSASGDFNGGVSYAPQAELEKEFYSFSANDEDFAVPHIENQIANSAKKSLRVIFIKGPENNGVENAAVALAKHIAEQKTAIYVLQKQADIGSLSNKLNVINSNINHKPEVHFVKYRTHEDAINAQKAIQSQYDSLGGVSNNYNGGEAPVLNFASTAPIASHASHGPSGSSGSSGSIGSPSSHVTSGSFESSSSVGSLGSSGHSAPSTSYIPPSGPSSTYLPA